MGARNITPSVFLFADQTLAPVSPRTASITQARQLDILAARTLTLQRLQGAYGCCVKQTAQTNSITLIQRLGTLLRMKSSTCLYTRPFTWAIDYFPNTPIQLRCTILQNCFAFFRTFYLDISFRTFYTWSFNYHILKCPERRLFPDILLLIVQLSHFKMSGKTPLSEHFTFDLSIITF